MKLVSPLTGRPLRADGPHSLTDGQARWPWIDGIAYLRVGRDALVRDVLRLLDGGERHAATALLLADQDGWWRGPTASQASLARLVGECDALSLRDAMGLLEWGPVADYFAHRWSDPTFVAGLGLVEAHLNAPAPSFELGCGIGHPITWLSQRGVAVSGGDVVFAKLWVARHWVAPEADLVCFDASSSWPIGSEPFDLVTCHDAFYFLEPKRAILDRLRALASGCLLISHVHNRDWPNYSAGSAVTGEEIVSLCPRAVLYDDAELSACVIERRAPRPLCREALDRVEAFGVAEGPSLPPARIIADGIAMPLAGTALRRNPLYDEHGQLRWPSERYAREYGPRATFAGRTDCPTRAVSGEAVEDWARRRELVELPERW